MSQNDRPQTPPTGDAKRPYVAPTVRDHTEAVMVFGTNAPRLPPPPAK